jgi:hypothetical protein
LAKAIALQQRRLIRTNDEFRCAGGHGERQESTSREVTMTKGEIIAHRRRLSPADQLAFDRWLKANLVIGSLMAGGLVLMAIVGSGASFGPEQASASSSPAMAKAGNRPLHDRDATPLGMMRRIKPGELPVQQVDSPF